MRRQPGEGDQERDREYPTADAEHRGEDACDQADERESRDHLVPRPAMLPRSWRARSKPGQDAGAPIPEGIGATEDDAWRRSSRARDLDGIAGRGTGTGFAARPPYPVRGRRVTSSHGLRRSRGGPRSSSTSTARSRRSSSGPRTRGSRRRRGRSSAVSRSRYALVACVSGRAGADVERLVGVPRRRSRRRARPRAGAGGPPMGRPRRASSRRASSGLPSASRSACRSTSGALRTRRPPVSLPHAGGGAARAEGLVPRWGRMVLEGGRRSRRTREPPSRRSCQRERLACALRRRRSDGRRRVRRSRRSRARRARRGRLARGAARTARGSRRRGRGHRWGAGAAPRPLAQRRRAATSRQERVLMTCSFVSHARRAWATPSSR